MQREISDKTGMRILVAAFVVSLALCFLRFERSGFSHAGLMAMMGCLVVTLTIFGMLRVHFLVEPEKRGGQPLTQLLIALLWICFLGGGLINRDLPFRHAQIDTLSICLLAVWLIMFLAALYYDKVIMRGQMRAQQETEH